MTNETKSLLEECKKADYEFVAIFVRDKRVPRTMTIKAGEGWFGWGTGRSPYKVVAAFPEKRCKHFAYKKGLWPAMWSIVKEQGLTAGMSFGGGGLGDAHNVNKVAQETLTAGCYDLSEL